MFTIKASITAPCIAAVLIFSCGCSRGGPGPSTKWEVVYEEIPIPALAGESGADIRMFLRLVRYPREGEKFRIQAIDVECGDTAIRVSSLLEIPGTSKMVDRKRGAEHLAHEELMPVELYRSDTLAQGAMTYSEWLKAESFSLP